MKNIKVKEITTVCPADEDTPKGSLWLSSLDLITRSPYTHTQLLFVFDQPSSSSSSSSSFFDTTLLKEGLCKVLVPFYPMAGRLKTGWKNGKGRIEIDCNAKGALFIEVETTHELDDFGDFTPSSELRKVVFPTYDYVGGLSSFPLLMVQLTRFKCGGVSLGIVHHHHVADGASCAHLINSWARLVRGLDLAVQPFHNRASCLSPSDPSQGKTMFRHLEYEPPLPPVPIKDLSGALPTVTERHFKFSKEQINTLKLLATSQGGTQPYKLSTFTVVAAHVWRASCNARGLKDEQDVKLYIPVDGRSRLKDLMPPGYYGNSIFFTACVTKVCNIRNKPLWYTASMIHKAVNKMNNIEYLRSAIDYLESQPNMDAFVRGAHTFTCPNFTINSWVNIPFNEADFGWGRPKFFRHGGIQYEGQSYLIANQNGDGSISLAIKLYTIHMIQFEEYLYDFSTPLVTRL
ncbi:shikimate O-hydroxycinnamoyltransferase-like [Chenopodium quinoa]|uniref:shikimate O-hydroxycinnamoyltransferase-like n=1 Tax=Chenopodium quinoa TaxID=63459 RepID=UPI000B771925|nr:shikimate O-hydroxycinnamoyltransferase-like [Chenopodium quinoa]